MEHPYLTAALLCEKILQETDGSLSVIRIADRITVQMQFMAGLQQSIPIGLAAPAAPVPVIQLACLVALRSGPLVGDYILRLHFIAPSGNVHGNALEQKINLPGKDAGQNVIFNIFFGAQEEGLYWIKVTLDDLELTRIPLTVVRNYDPVPGLPPIPGLSAQSPVH